MTRHSYFFAVLFCTFALWATNVSAATKNVLPSIASAIGQTATRNIEKSERLFCYLVSSKSQNYSGYTIDNMAIDGFCGIVDENLRDILIEQLLATQSNIDFNNVENCTIQPRVLLRFVRGIDNTDILISAPCHSISVFYGGALKTYNMKPAANVLDTIANAFKTSQTSFVSPALLNQLLPVGVPQTTVSKVAAPKDSQVKRNWGTSDSQPQNNAWNSLNFSK